MSFPNDFEIASKATLRPITEVAATIGLQPEDLDLYGSSKAKLTREASARLDPRAKLVIVTAISPTAAGEGKTTTSIGLSMGLKRIGKNVATAIREPSLGPVFGIKGGAAGGGYAQVIPMEDINLHFTGDLHAITSANGLLAAALDNHLQQGNELFSHNAIALRVQMRIVTNEDVPRLVGVDRAGQVQIRQTTALGVLFQPIATPLVVIRIGMSGQEGDGHVTP